MIAVAMLTSLFFIVGQTLLVSAAMPKQQVVAQVTPLNDVKPTDHYFQALQSLVERYGCVRGFKDMAMSHARGLQRGELITSLDLCVGRINEMLELATKDMPKAEDLGTIQKLLREVEADVSSIRR